MERPTDRTFRIRFTITDPTGTISFVGPCHAIKMLVAACAGGAGSIDELMALLREYDDTLPDQVQNGLRVFDELNLRDNTTAIEQTLAGAAPVDWPPFRVFNAQTRDASTRPSGTGLIIFNLAAKRIIQVQNSYADIQRQDRGRHRKAGRPVQRLYHYDLPSEWSLVP